MPNQSQSIEKTFSALSDPTRRAVVQTLSNGPATVSELASPFAMALPSFTQHLGILESAGLIVSRKDGRTRVCSLNVTALQAAEDWLASHRRQWEDRLDRLEAHLAKVRKEKSNE
jgi:DNA-binding transcriptional ArsR family regulator